LKANNNIEIYEYKQQIDKFILTLVNINYYNKKQSSFESKLIKSYYYKSAYLKMVYPICTKETKD